MKTTKVFRLAKQLVATNYNVLIGQEEYICHAIEKLYGDMKITLRDRNRNKKIIRDRLDGVISYETWLIRNYKINLEISDYHKRSDKLQVSRHAWLDSLIKEFEAIGD
jgi:hypothetical protein